MLTCGMIPKITENGSSAQGYGGPLRVPGGRDCRRSRPTGLDLKRNKNISAHVADPVAAANFADARN